ncbi:MAG: RCC1 domain-containing protein [Polyangiales bacterium]
MRSCSRPFSSLVCALGLAIVSAVPVGAQSPDGVRFLGDEHGFCIARADGVQRCWGRHAASESVLPVTLARLPPMRTVALAGTLACGVRASDGSTLCFGADVGVNTFGRVLAAGEDVPGDEASPARAVMVMRGRYEHLAGRDEVVCGVTPAGRVECFGSVGVPFVRGGDDADHPLRTFPVPFRGRASAIATDGLSACVITTPGERVQCVGRSESLIWTRVEPVIGLRGVRQLAMTAMDVYAVDAEGRLFSTAVDFAPNEAAANYRGPQRAFLVRGVTGVRSVVASDDHACVQTAGGAVLCFGENHYGQLGNGTTDAVTGFVEATRLAGAIEIAVAVNATCGRFDSGEIRCVGANEQGEFGRQEPSNLIAPRVMLGSDGSPVLAERVEVGFQRTCVRTRDGASLCWGPLGSHDHRGIRAWATPTEGTPPPAPTRPPEEHCVLVDQHVHCGDVGAERAVSTIPEPANGLVSAYIRYVAYTDREAVAFTLVYGRAASIERHAMQIVGAFGGGDRPACVVLADGELRCWGAAPVREFPGAAIPGVVSPTSVDVSSSHMCAIHDGGHVSCWGKDGHGQLGVVPAWVHPEPVTLSIRAD